jgi:hypothetical protein
MPKFDTCHQQVTHALQKDGWRIVAEQFMIVVGDRKGFVDVRAVREDNGTRQQIMLVEIKCFLDPDDTTQELYTAIGQYIIYRALMVQLRLEALLYLAIPDDVFATVFDSAVQWALENSRISVVTVNLETETIKEWIAH